MKPLLFKIIVLLPLVCFPQKYGNIWYFADSAGIDFNSCGPTLLTNGQTPPSEGCATICDSSGQLLFYTNSDVVWNRQHVQMPNGSLIASNGTLSQVIIIPKPLTPGIFYIITTQIQGQPTIKAQYHMVDMTLNGGLGDVTTKNNILTDSVITEQIAATYHANGADIWLMTHEYGNNKFVCYLITSSGISNPPVISNVGPAIIPCSSGFNARGEMKFSPNGSKLAFNNNGIGFNLNSDYLCLFDFDHITGTVSNPINLAYERGGFGLSFSPDNTKLYASTWKAFGFSASDTNKLFQFDLIGNDSATISATKVILGKSPQTAGTPYGSIKIGPEGKVYVTQANSNYIGAISNPNQPGLACSYQSNGLYLGSQTCRTGLNNYIEYKAYCSENSINSMELGEMSVFPNPTSGVFSVISTLEYQHVLIYNGLGQIKKAVNTHTKNQEIDIRKEPAGIYICRIKYANNERIFKIVKTDP